MRRPTAANESPPIRLIVNADDYGYFSSVTRGIVDGAHAGVVTATGVMANSPDLAERLRWMNGTGTLDWGVHLNLTYGEPLTGAMATALERWQGRFPGKFAMISAIVSRRIAADTVETEWRAQIGRCLDNGLQLRFLNSHEHVHMLPPLFAVTERLADEFGIRHVRHTRPEWMVSRPLQGCFRNVVLGGLAALGAARARRGPPIGFLGLAVSGRLTLDYLRERLPRLVPGACYELMCHPGHFDADEIRDPALRAYHAWESELAVLRSPAFGELCREHGVALSGYRELGT